MYLQEFFNKYNGKKLDWDKAYGAQCVDLFRYFCSEVLEISQPKAVKGAKDFWGNHNSDTALNINFTKILNTPVFIPQFGDIAVFNNGTYGHISICTGKGTTSKFESFDQNFPENSACHFQEHDYKTFYGVLRPKNQSKLMAPVQSEFSVRVDKEAANVRTESNTKSTIVIQPSGKDYLARGTVFLAVGTVMGESINGNNIWYKSKKGNFVWSGGLTKI